MNALITAAQTVATPSSVSVFSFCSPFDLEWLCKQFERISGFACGSVGTGKAIVESLDDGNSIDPNIIIPDDLPLFRVRNRRQADGDIRHLPVKENRFRDEGSQNGGDLEFEDKVILISTLRLPDLNEKALELLSRQLGRIFDYARAIYVVVTNPFVEKNIAIFGAREAEELFLEKINELHPDDKILTIIL